MCGGCGERCDRRVVHRDQRVAELFVLDKIQRQSSHAVLRAVVAQLCQLVPRPLSRSRLPSGVLLAPVVEAGQRALKLPDHTLVRVDTATSSVLPVFPVGFDVSSLLIVGHVLDRGSTNVCALSFALHKNLLWHCTWGWFHDLWDAS